MKKLAGVSRSYLSSPGVGFKEALIPILFKRNGVCATTSNNIVIYFGGKEDRRQPRT